MAQASVELAKGPIQTYSSARALRAMLNAEQ